MITENLLFLFITLSVQFETIGAFNKGKPLDNSSIWAKEHNEVRDTLYPVPVVHMILLLLVLVY